LERNVTIRTDFGIDLCSIMDHPLREGDAVLVSIRPEKIDLLKQKGAEDGNWMEGEIRKKVFLANYFQYDVEVNGYGFAVLSFQDHFAEGEKVMLRIKTEHSVIIPTS